jgi:hypothetical protein
MEQRHREREPAGRVRPSILLTVNSASQRKSVRIRAKRNALVGHARRQGEPGSVALTKPARRAMRVGKRDASTPVRVRDALRRDRGGPIPLAATTGHGQFLVRDLDQIAIEVLVAGGRFELPTKGL